MNNVAGPNNPRHYDSARRRLRYALDRTTHELAPREIALPAIVFAPHPDDETLGCGGTIVKKTRAAATVDIVVMTDGRTSHGHLMPAAELAALRQREVVAASGALGVPADRVSWLGFEDGRLGQSVPQALLQVLEILQQRRPKQIFIPYLYGGAPADHAVTSRIVLKALRHSGLQATVYEYPVWFWQHWPWVPVLDGTPRKRLRLLQRSVLAGFGLRMLKDFRHSVAIGDVRAEKRQALDLHASQMTRLVADAGWATLSDVSQGTWLDCFFADREIFCQRQLRDRLL